MEVRSTTKVLAAHAFLLGADSFAWVFAGIHAYGSLGVVGFGSLFFLTFLSAVVFIAMTREYRLRHHMMVGAMARAAAFTLIGISIFLASTGKDEISLILLMVAGVMSGAFFTFYWIPCNIIYQGDLLKGERAEASSRMFLVYAVLGVVLPVLSVYLVELTGYLVICLLAALSCFGGLVVVRSFPSDITRKVDRGRMSRNYRKVGPVTSLEGFFQGINHAALALISLHEVDSLQDVGLFLSFIALLGAVSNTVFGRISDRTGTRMRYFHVFVVATGLSLVLAGITRGPLTWFLFMGLANFFFFPYFNFAWVWVSERADGLTEAMAVRESCFNIARSLSLGLLIMVLLLVPMDVEPDVLRTSVTFGGIALLGISIYLRSTGEDDTMTSAVLSQEPEVRGD